MWNLYPEIIALIPIIGVLGIFAFIMLFAFMMLYMLRKILFGDNDYDNDHDNNNGSGHKPIYPKDGGFSEEILVKYK